MKNLYLLIIIIVSIFTNSESKTIHAIEKRLIKLGLINIQKLDPTIQVDLKYSTTENFLNKDVYGDLNNCYLHKIAAQKLLKAKKLLIKLRPGYNFLVYDGARPHSVQKQMWEIVKNSSMRRYVANPQKGSIHSYGFAIDLTIIDENGRILDMGTPFDHLGKLAEPRHEKKYLKLGKLTRQQVEYRKLLRNVMTKAGFQYIRNEWWHFNALPRKIVKRNYKRIN